MAPTRRLPLLALAVLATACSGLRPSRPPDVAERVGVDVISTEAGNEYNPSPAPDGRTLVFARSEADFRNARVLVARRADGGWTAPAPAAFGDPRWSDSDPTLSPDGRTLYFVSDRPAPGRDTARRDLDLWRVARRGDDAWGTPERLPDGVNSRAQELGPTVHDGVLYFASTRGGRATMLDIFQARLDGAGVGPATPLPGAVNGPASESDPEITRDGRFLLLWSDRPGGAGGGDLYVATRTADGWSTPRPLQGGVNGPGFEFTPSVSADGRWLWYAGTGAADGLADVYRIPLAAALR